MIDLCPTRAENFNGIEDSDGCPDDYIVSHDQDRDGIPDALDECPSLSEVYNRFMDTGRLPGHADGPHTDGYGR